VDRVSDGPDRIDAEPLERLRGFCALLPETTEVEVFGNPTFRVGARGFVTFEELDPGPSACVKVAPEMQELLVRREGFEAEPDTGHFGWTRVRIDGTVDWEEVDELVIGSYRLVAPPEYVTQLDELLAAGG
jgi:predicted DNA-binding protein (MmcQ/YjbR family)